MKTRLKVEIKTFFQYFIIAALSLILAEVAIFMIVYAGEGEINIAGYFRKHLDGRLFWLSVFFIIIGAMRIILVVWTSQGNKGACET